MAQGITHRMASGVSLSVSELAKKDVASTVAIPAFCMPTSIEIVRFLAVLKPNKAPML